MILKKSFASDNNSGVHPRIMSAINEANQGHYVSYGDDYFTKQALEIFKEEFGEDTEAYLVMTGTAANILSIKNFLPTWGSVICSENSHIHVDECGALEMQTGGKVIYLPANNGKITPAQIEPLFHTRGDEHHSQPMLVSISQTTELGTVYSLDEIKQMSDFCHEKGLLLHIDGARIANAAVSLNTSFRAMTFDLGVDCVSFGGTKNGLFCAEAVLFKDKTKSQNFKYIRKQGMQLVSKMRFIACQYLPYFKENIWQSNALQANTMATYLAEELNKIDKVKITRPVQANAVFLLMPAEIIPTLQEDYFFYIWDYDISEVRLMTSFDTTKEDIDKFISCLKAKLF